MAIVHYDGPLGIFDYDNKEFMVINGDDSYSLYGGHLPSGEYLIYIGTEIDGSKIVIPDGVLDVSYMFCEEELTPNRGKMEIPPRIPDSVIKVPCNWIDVYSIDESYIPFHFSVEYEKFDDEVDWLRTKLDIAKGLIGCMDEGSFSKLPEEEHLKILMKDLQRCHEECSELFDVLEVVNKDDFPLDPEWCSKSWFSPDDTELYSQKTDYGTSYGDIALFLLVSLDTAVSQKEELAKRFHDYDYDPIWEPSPSGSELCESLLKAPEHLKYYLSVACEHKFLEMNIGRER